MVQDIIVEGGGWVPPIQGVAADTCQPVLNPVRPTTSPEDQCGIAPEVYNLRVNGGGATTINDSAGFVHLTFNSKVDSQQLPLAMYKIDWGDETEISETGIKMMHKPNAKDPHSFYHLYSYWDLLAKSTSNFSINCAISGGGCCRIFPQIRIKDNWNWYFPSINGWHSGPFVDVCK